MQLMVTVIASAAVLVVHSFPFLAAKAEKLKKSKWARHGQGNTDKPATPR
jgi:hypothetical protein